MSMEIKKLIAILLLILSSCYEQVDPKEHANNPKRCINNFLMVWVDGQWYVYRPCTYYHEICRWDYNSWWSDEPPMSPQKDARCVPEEWAKEVNREEIN